MSSYGHIVTILVFCVGGSTAAIHRVYTGDARVRIPLETIFFRSIIFSNAHCIVKVTNTELQDINQLMGYRDAQ